jgi:N utilization substance protein A
VNIDMAALRMLEREREIPFETLVRAIEQALLVAYHRTEHEDHKAHPDARVELDRASGEVRVLAKDRDDEGLVTGEFDDTPSGFGRIAAMTARQVILQRLRDAEDDVVLGEYADTEGEIVSGVIQQGRDPRVVQVALEVPEIADGTVQITALSREAGHRSKMAVRAMRSGINAKGACIGPMGQRVRAVMAELRGEKVDIVDHSDDPAEFVGNALSPARVSSVEVVDLAARSARVIVPDYQLSLAIGKEGQNARLAAKLTGWRIDIRPDTVADAEPSAKAPSAGEA